MLSNENDSTEIICNGWQWSDQATRQYHQMGVRKVSSTIDSALICYILWQARFVNKKQRKMNFRNDNLTNCYFIVISRNFLMKMLTEGETSAWSFSHPFVSASSVSRQTEKISTNPFFISTKAQKKMVFWRNVLFIKKIRGKFTNDRYFPEKLSFIYTFLIGKAKSDFQFKSN